METAAIATPRIKRKLPPRSEQMQVLQSGEEYDVLVIGGGATGAGVALDSITRGEFDHNVIVHLRRVQRTGQHLIDNESMSRSNRVRASRNNARSIVL